MSVIQAPSQTLCKYRRSLDAIRQDPECDEDDAAMIADWVAGYDPAAQVSRTLRKAGYNVSATTVKDHRRGECACRVDI